MLNKKNPVTINRAFEKREVLLNKIILLKPKISNIRACNKEQAWKISEAKRHKDLFYINTNMQQQVTKNYNHETPKNLTVPRSIKKYKNN